MNRVREWHLFVQNPFNAHRFARVDLSPSNIEVILFWTKNPAPLLRHLDELDAMGYRYYFQFTLTAHPKLIEQSVPDEEELLATFRNLSTRVGAEKVIWRFDPILVSDVTPEDDIIERFASLAGRLSGQTERVVISFAHFYKTVKGRLNKVQKETGVNFYDISDDSRRIYRIAREMASIARSNSMDITSCAETLNLAECGIGHGRCVDDGLIKKIFGITVSSLKDRYQREQCRCVGSQDIGQYDTCLHDCLYCYANPNQSRVHRNNALHDPESPFLIGRLDEPTNPATGKTLDPLQG